MIQNEVVENFFAAHEFFSVYCGYQYNPILLQLNNNLLNTYERRGQVGLKRKKDIYMKNADVIPATYAFPGSAAEQILQIKQERIWIESFRTCSACNSVGETLTLYRFHDGSQILLDSAFPFPRPVLSEQGD